MSWFGARLVGRCALFLLLLALAPVARAANDPQLVPFEIFVNEQDEGVAPILLGAEDVWVPPDVLERAGLISVPGARRTVDGTEYVSLHSMAPELRYSIDDRTIALRIVIVPQWFQPTTLDLFSTIRPGDFRLASTPSLFANYSLELASEGGPGIFTELGGSIGKALLVSGWSKAPGQHPVRGLTTLTFDQPEAIRRWDLGETFTSSGLLGGSALIAGLGVQTDLSLDPYRVHHPLPQLSGNATTPSKLDVYVNGRLIREETVNPGAFTLQNLPVQTGAGLVQYVLHDAFGRTETLSAQYYLDSQLLSAGEADYSYQLGFPRLKSATESFSFSPHPALILRHRVGITDHLTFGGRFEGGWRLANGGPTVSYALPLGELNASASVSSGEYHFGAAGALAYSLITRALAVGADVQLESSAYSNLSLVPAQDRPILQADVYAGTPLMRGVSLFLDYQHATWRDSGNQDSFGLRADYNIRSGVVLVASAQRTSDPLNGAGFGGQISLLITFDKDTLGQLSTGRAAGHTSVEGAVEKPLPPYSGYGYRLIANEQGITADAQVEPTFMRFEGAYQHLGSSNGAQLFASGALVYMDHTLAATQPLQNGYALIEVPGVKGVRGQLNNQTVGTTDADGKLLIPNIASYVANRVGIVTTDVPLDYDVPINQLQVSTPFRAGTVVRFEARRFVMITGTIALLSRAAEVPPSYGELSLEVNGKTITSPLGKEGAFYLESVPPGRYVGQVHSDSGDCVVSIEIPKEDSSAIDLGKLTCPKIAAPTEASGSPP